MYYVAWSLVLFGVISLWAVAMSQISAHLRGDVFSVARLATMALTVSAVAVVTVIAAGAAFSNDPPWTNAPARISSEEPACTGGVMGSFVFSFGLEQGSRAPSDCPARSTGG